ncbi:hypothetical protein B296_00024745 [Ensete ventricosum]|uniref:Uncharacterized protein n=1 Tax=Ensete ventricosum TaxID=4639 RepID=A0A426XFL3_ENSVE|nr:hypothetical protein B296_00024745 [Ensete ventricosum]
MNQGSDNTVGAQREFVGGRSRFERYCQELVESSLEVYQEVLRELADRLSGARQEFIRRIWKFVGSTRSMPGVHVRTLADSKFGVIFIGDRPPWNSIGVPPSLVLKPLAKKRLIYS